MLIDGVSQITHPIPLLNMGFSAAAPFEYRGFSTIGRDRRSEAKKMDSKPHKLDQKNLITISR
jgi:hypothetical protein